MKDYIEERAVEIAGYIIETKATVRQTAKQFGISKSTVHKDCTDRLLQINPSMARRSGMCWMSTNRSVISGEEWRPGRSICILESKDTK